MASAQLRKIVEQLRSDPLSRATTLLEMRALHQAGAAQADLPEIQHTPVRAESVGAEWISRSPHPARQVLYLHGGGYVLGSLATHRKLAAHVAREADASVLAIDYRLAPEHPFPAALEDALSAYRWMLARGVSPERLAIAGDSCGGGLGLALMLRAKEEGLPLPAAAVCFSPWVDLALTGGSLRDRALLDPSVTGESLRDMAAAYLAGVDPKTPHASPLYGDLRGLPPLLIQVGTHEVLFDDAVRLSEIARQAGVDVELEAWDEMFHVWQAFVPDLPEAQRALERAGAFLRSKVRAY